MVAGSLLFNLELDREIDRLEEQAIGWGADVLEYAWRGLFTRTPVDTGKFKGSWRVSLNGRVNTIVPDYRDPNGGITFARGFKVIHALRDSVKMPFVTLYNNQPYGQKLENGHSAQAPQGIVAITVENVYARYGV